MKLVRFCVPALLVLTCISAATAQDSIRLRFEVYRNEAPVGNPEVSVMSGTAGSLTIDGIGRIAFTPSSRDSESISIAFDIDSAGRHLQPRMVLRGDDPGSVSWSSAAGREAFRFTVTRVRQTRPTIYEASERDFRVVVIADATSDFDERARSELQNIGVAVQDTDPYLRDAV